MDSILSGLNAAQRAAVTSPVSVLQVLAPPGSGKTKTLTSRVAYLLRHCDYKPWNIICLTFTIKSSTEMKERISKLIGHGIEKKLILGTFHSVCRRYLVAYGHLIGVKKDFGIADSSDQISIIKRIIKRLGLNIDPKKAQSRISNSKSKGLSYHDLAHELMKEKNVEQQEIFTLFEAYDTQLAASNLLDYDDLLLRCVYLLRTHPTCISNIEVVLVDEFQDTNVVQFDLLRLFATNRKRITTVGDPDQSIYGWRSAEVKNLKRMQKEYSDTMVIRLEDNYRSSGAILLAAQEVIEQDESRPQKAILPTHCPGTVPVLRKLPSADIEASWTVIEIQRMIALTGHLLDYSDFAILLRSAALSRLLESAMGKAGIPYRMVGGKKFFDRVEIRVLLDYLRVVSQPDNNDALVRIINIPPRGIGAATVTALLEEAERQKDTLWTLVRNSLKGHKSAKTKISKAAEQGLSSLTNIILTARNKLLDLANPKSPEELIRHISKKLDFQSYLEKTHAEDHEARWANVEELVAQAAEYCISSPQSITQEKEHQHDVLPHIDGVEQEMGNAAEEALSTFLANVALAAAVDLPKEDESEGDQPQSQVTISTMHAAKGLEWPVVFVPSAYQGSIPHSRAEDTDEERRLLYVAMTRAQALLYVSCPVKNSQREETTLSPFLSTKKVGRFLTNQGPTINAPAVVDIAGILRRDCPSGEDIELHTRGLQSTHDDLWPLTGEENVAAIQARWSKWDDRSNQSDFKRRRMMKETSTTKSSEMTGYCVASKTTTYIGSSTTMENSAAFTYQSGGFSTASAQLQLAKEAKQDGLRSRSPEKRTNAQGDKQQKQNREGGSLLSLWGIKEQTEARSETPVLPTPAHHTAAGKPSQAKSIAGRPTNQLQRDAEASAPRVPLATIPQELSAHRLQPLMKRPAPHEYVFLSSSPPQPETTTEVADSRTETSAGKPGQVEKPAQTFHTTTISQLHQTSDMPKKTLGVRRNMAGWSTRPNQGFKVPSMAPRQT